MDIQDGQIYLIYPKAIDVLLYIEHPCGVLSMKKTDVERVEPNFREQTPRFSHEWKEGPRETEIYF